MTTAFLTRRRLLVAALAAGAAPALAAGPGLSPEDQALAERARAWLQDLTEASARFVQVDARGRTSQGTLYLKRPGKARFAYDPPSGLLVVSDGSVVSVVDSRLQTFDRYPLGATPLSLFLARNVRLDRGVVVTGVVHDAGGFSVTLRDASKKAVGQLTLSFADPPLALTGWTVTDAQGRYTQVRLSGLQRTSGLDPALFVMKTTRLYPGRPRM